MNKFMSRDLWPELSDKDRFIKLPELITLQAVVDGLKPSAAIDEIFEEEVIQTGLPYGYITKKGKMGGGSIVVAKTKEKVKELLELFHQSNLIHKKIGLTLGFPKTAVEAWIKGYDYIYNNKFPEGYISIFTLSKDHYQDEMKVVKLWVDNAKQKHEERMK